eukprot:TRINITY_DN6116_c0_g3_i3.p1 TRINITY_DN6116_c0_g3~~TRINITY_DN6116_c0_g3_i3.p1  ORF type:complete len:336 (+),score=68.13 TRINITY_DN6116_c0_g3_i3:77-1009(+)
MPRLEVALLLLPLVQAATAGAHFGAVYRRGAAHLHAPAAADSCSTRFGFVHIPKCGGTGMLTSLKACCGSRSLQNASLVTRPRRGGDSFFWFHSTALEQRAAVGPEAWRGAYTFALVRNPWDQQVSRFFFHASRMCAKPESRPRVCAAHLFHSRKQELGPQDFQQWVRIMHKAYPPGSPLERVWAAGPGQGFHFNSEWGYHGAAQWYWITDPTGKLLVDDVIKLEHLEQNWPLLQSRICGLRAVSYAQHSARGRGLCAGARGCPNGTSPAHAERPPKRRRRQDYYDSEARDIVAMHMKLDIDNLNYSFYD